ncbi:MAG: hypothetical protein GF353_11145 [Candidatus Lokiarchaeota archaeon]|nr:hypothetical protein [Candidatus Lokiarchaeota archaeon]
MNLPFKEVVLDGGTIIELLLLGQDSSIYKNILNEEIIPIATILAIIEAEYILCKKLGKDKSFEKVDNLVNSNYIVIEPLEHFYREISILKCNVPIALADCATIALATNYNVPALFARREAELKKPIREKAFKIEIFFVKDL